MQKNEMSLVLLQRLTSEIGQISEAQTNDLQRSVFVGMTEEDFRRYEERNRRLHELVIELDAITSQRTV